MTITSSLQQEYTQIRENCGYAILDKLDLIDIRGKDCASYLQTQTTNDILALSPGAGQNSAIVDRTAKLIASFSLHQYEDYAYMALVESNQSEAFKNHLETFIFREDVTLTPIAPEKFVVGVQGPKSSLILKSFGIESLPEKPNQIENTHFQGSAIQIINKSFSNEDGYILLVPESQKDSLETAINEAQRSKGLIQISADILEVLRIEAGLPKFGLDMDPGNILPETGLEHTSVSYNKGCYIGQEVIARLKTYGSPSIALMGLIIDGETLPPANHEILLQTKKIGILKSTVFSPALNKVIALAYLKKEFRTPDTEMDVTIGGAPFKIKVTLTPFYQVGTRRDHAEHLLNEALTLYKSQDNLDKPIQLLREAIELDPKNASAYESLGVMLSKQDKLDEAIGLMKRLVEIDPTEVMAHTNLSVYYMKQGRIEDAEMEKAEATALQFEKVMAEKMAEKQQEANKGQKRKEQLEKIDMFKQVLEIDAVDQVANFGLGTLYYDMGQYDNALAPLQTLTAEYKDYSAAYLLLGKTLDKLGKKEEAIKVFKRGIEAASKKGDLMPMKDMQTRLSQIQSGQD